MEVVIRDTVVWNASRDLEGDLTIAKGGQLTIRCRLSMPPGGVITVHPGGVLILDEARIHNACGLQWEGIEVQKFATDVGRVVYLGQPRFENMAREIK